MQGLTLQLPVVPSTADPGGQELIKTYPDLVKQNLKNLFLTSPGERVMDSKFGVGLRQFLFEPNVEQTYGIIRARIDTQVAMYMPYLNVLDVVFDTRTSSEDNWSGNFLSLRVFYKILPLDLIDALDITVLPN
jgi:phage baseplate assembly protein W